MRYVSIDVETSGLSYKKARIIQLSGVDYTPIRKSMLDMVGGVYPLDTFDTYLNPGCKIDQSAIDVHGITDKMVENSPRFEHIAQMFLEFCDGAILVGHNIKFDLRFINTELIRAGFPQLTNDYIDTLQLARNLLKGEENYKLESLNAKYNFYNGKAHDALSDSIAAAKLECYIEIFAQQEPSTVY